MWSTHAVTDADRLDRAAARRVLRRTVELAAPFRRLAAITLVFVALSTASTLLGPVIIRFAIDDGIRAGDGRALDLAVAAYVAVAIVALVGARQQYVYVNRTGEGFLRRLRLELFDHIQRQPLAFFDRNRTGVLVSRMTADIESLSELVQWGLLQFVSATLLVAFALVVLLALSWQLTLLALVVMPLIVIASIRFQRRSNVAYLDVRDRVAATLSALQENIAGIRVIQASAREDEQRRRFRTVNRQLYGAHLHSVRIATWYFGVVEFLGVLATAIAVGVGAWLAGTGQVSVGTVIAVVLLLSSLFEPVQQLSQLYNSLQSAGASLNKMFEILDTRPEIEDAPDAVPAPSDGSIDVEHVTFAYPATSQPVLRDVTLHVRPGERLAVVGATGSGKSSLAKLIARLYDADEGTVRIGGVDVRDITLESLRREIVVVPQEGFVFGGSVADNLRLAAPDASDEQLWAAVRSIGVAERFEQLPEGLDTDVLERGGRLSAGERQLVALCRSALVDPSVLVLDEATSSLDPGTEQLVEGALDALMARRTTVVVAHRISTVERCDRVAVIDGGRLVELGPPARLAEQGGAYAALAAAWRADTERRAG